jgi:gamma-glutamylcyclotransferase
MDQWYFAYGSNLLSEQMVARTGPIRTGDERSRIARLPNYRLVFNVLGDDGCTYANIARRGDDVLGVIYRCGEEELKKLDYYEHEYERQFVVVIDVRAAIELQAVVYVARPESVTDDGRPSADYLQRILTGARAHGLPQEYIRSIEATALGFAAR